MRSKNAVDFHAVEPGHREIDRRLANWAAWCNGGWSSHQRSTSPMFGMVPPPPRVRGEIAYNAGAVVNKIDAAKVAKAVFALPERHRKAVHWAYIRPGSPAKKAKELGLSLDGLARHLRDGRQMLLNTVAPLVD